MNIKMIRFLPFLGLAIWILWLLISWMVKKNKSDQIFEQTDYYWREAHKTDDIDRKLEYYKRIEDILVNSFSILSSNSDFDKATEELAQADVMIRKYSKRN